MSNKIETPKLTKKERELWLKGSHKNWMGIFMHEIIDDKSSPTGKGITMKYRMYDMGIKDGKPVPLEGYEFDLNDPIDAETSRQIEQVMKGLNSITTMFFFKKLNNKSKFRKIKKEEKKPK